MQSWTHEITTCVCTFLSLIFAVAEGNLIDLKCQRGCQRGYCEPWVVGYYCDLYEGTRMARAADIPGIKQILQPLEEFGTLIRRTEEELLEALDSFIVVEREGQIIACAALFPYFKEKCGEVASIAVSPDCRGQGQGDKLLDYIEKKASSHGIQKLFLLTTRTADWFIRRGFSECSIDQIPVERRKKINLSRGSKYYMKKLQPDRSGIRFGSVIA